MDHRSGELKENEHFQAVVSSSWTHSGSAQGIVIPMIFPHPDRPTGQQNNSRKYTHSHRTLAAQNNNNNPGLNMVRLPATN